MNKFSKIISIMFVLGVVFVLSSCGKKEHIHEFDEGKIIQDATCTTEGIKEYKCNGCSETKQETIQKLEHIYETTTIEPTCTKEGLKTTKCKLCGNIDKEEIKEKLEHRKVIDKEVLPTCLNTGLTKGSHCDICGEIFDKQEIVSKDPHKYMNGACIECRIAEPSKGLRYSLAPDKQSYIVAGRGTFSGNKISIPSEYEGLPVTGIDNRAFYDDRNLVSITISYTINVIGEEAFGLCRNLNEIIFENDAQVHTISKKAFSECKSLEKITLPKTVKIIEEMVFNECVVLTDVIFEKGSVIESIAVDSFLCCYILENIILDENNNNFEIINSFLMATNNKEEFICYLNGRQEKKLLYLMEL